ASALADTNAKCGSMRTVRQCLKEMCFMDCNDGRMCKKNEFVEKALETFKQMQLVRVKPDSTTFFQHPPSLCQNGSFRVGLGQPSRHNGRGFLVANALVDKYANCGSLHKASQLFDKMPQRNVVSWNARIARYAHNGSVQK
ncbi:hypothetical protein KI387_042056, partial [Taxus chinensis]